MAYCRFADADAYIYDDVRYGIICCACWIMPEEEIETDIFGEYQRYFIGENFIAGTDYDKMLAHIAEHRELGHHIPEYVDRRLILERDCPHKEINDAGFCKHCWRGMEKDDYHSDWD